MILVCTDCHKKLGYGMRDKDLRSMGIVKRTNYLAGKKKPKRKGGRTATFCFCGGIYKKVGRW